MSALGPKQPEPNANHIMCGNVHDFVRHWMGFVMQRVYNPSVNRSGKDWGLLESLSYEQFSAFSQQQTISNVISFQVNKKTHPPLADRHVVQAINRIVRGHCIDCELTLPGFYAFLRDITALQQRNPKHFVSNDNNKPSDIKKAVGYLVKGYWDAVRPSVNGAQYENIQQMQQDAAVLQAIEKHASSQPENNLDPKLPFQASQEKNHVLNSQPGVTPTLTR